MTPKQYTAGYREFIAAVQKGPLSADMRKLGQQLLQSNLPGGKKKDVAHGLALPDFKDDGDMVEPSAAALNRFNNRAEGLLSRISEENPRIAQLKRQIQGFEDRIDKDILDGKEPSFVISKWLSNAKDELKNLMSSEDEALKTDKERAAAQKKSASDIKQALRQKGSNTVAFHGREEEPKKPAANLMARQKWGMDKILYRVNSDNFKGLMTPAAYKEATLQMSSGDFGSHTKVEVPLMSAKPDETVWDYASDPSDEEPEDAFFRVSVRSLR